MLWDDGHVIVVVMMRLGSDASQPGLDGSVASNHVTWLQPELEGSASLSQAQSLPSVWNDQGKNNCEHCIFSANRSSVRLGVSLIHVLIMYSLLLQLGNVALPRITAPF